MLAEQHISIIESTLLKYLNNNAQRIVNTFPRVLSGMLCKSLLPSICNLVFQRSLQQSSRRILSDALWKIWRFMTMRATTMQ